MVGKWYNDLQMHESDVLFDASTPKDVIEVPNSVCSFPCKTGEIMIMNTVSVVSRIVISVNFSTQNYVQFVLF